MNQTFWLTMKDGTEIFNKHWYHPVSKPKAIVQIAHGMVEHIERYHEFAEFLVQHNIFVYGNDHRGHGKTGEKQGLFGYFADMNGFDKVTGDLTDLTDYIKQAYPNVPVILLGHSMGSFLARRYIQTDSTKIDGVILSGTGYYSHLKHFAAKIIASALPQKEKSLLMNELAFFFYNNRIKNKRTNFDWLTSDETMIQPYLDDPYCGFIPTAGFFYDLMTGVGKIHNQSLNKAIRHDIPIMMVSGTEDPVGDYENGIWKTADLYEKAGLTEIMVMLFDNGRHEILNEKNREEVYQFLLSWMNTTIIDNA